MMQKPIVIGIAGGSGSGKTTFATRICARFPGDSVILSHDFYYRAFTGLPLAERKKQNFDHPDSFDTPLMVQDIRRLAAWQSIRRPLYSFTEFTRMPKTAAMQPARVLLVEGILIFDSREIRDLCDIKIFIDTDSDERLIRRILRDVKERGRTLDSVLAQYLSTVKPMHDRFVEPSKKYSDIIVPTGGCNLVALDIVTNRIEAYLTNNPRISQ